MTGLITEQPFAYNAANGSKGPKVTSALKPNRAESDVARSGRLAAAIAELSRFSHQIFEHRLLAITFNALGSVTAILFG